MPRFDASDLWPIALRALDEAFEAAAAHPGRSWSARLALACLAHDQQDRAPFVTFWQALDEPDDTSRQTTLRTALNAIRRKHGLGPR